MLIFILFQLTQLNLSFHRGFDTNLMLDTSYLHDYYNGLDLTFDHYPIEKPWGYELALGGSFFDNYTSMNFLTFGGNLSYFKDFGEAGNYMESGVDFTWDVISPYKSLTITPGVASEIYLGEKKMFYIIPSWDFNLLLADASYNFENIPKLSLNGNFFGISAELTGMIKWRYAATYVVSPRGIKYLPHSARYTWVTKSLSAGNAGIRLEKRFGDFLGISYEFDYHFLPTSNLVSVDNLKQRLDPLNEEEFAYSGISHTFIVNLIVSKVAIDYTFALSSKDYNIVDTSQSPISRHDNVLVHSITGRIPLFKNRVEVGLSGFFGYESNTSTMQGFSYTRKEGGAGLYMGL